MPNFDNFSLDLQTVKSNESNRDDNGGAKPDSVGTVIAYTVAKTNTWV